MISTSTRPRVSPLTSTSATLGAGCSAACAKPTGQSLSQQVCQAVWIGADRQERALAGSVSSRDARGSAVPRRCNRGEQASEVWSAPPPALAQSTRGLDQVHAQAACHAKCLPGETLRPRRPPPRRPSACSLPARLGWTHEHAYTPNACCRRPQPGRWPRLLIASSAYTWTCDCRRWLPGAPPDAAQAEPRIA